MYPAYLFINNENRTQGTLQNITLTCTGRHKIREHKGNKINHI